MTILACDDNCQLSRLESVGLSYSAVSAIVSLVAILYLFVLLTYNLVKYLRNTPRNKRSLLRNPMNVYLILLFTSNLVHAIGQGMNAKWVYDGVVRTGTYCTVQGIFGQVGETAGVLATLAISVHTFVVLVTRKGYDSRATAICIVLIICVFVVGFVLGEVGKDGATQYITPTPYWCWISRNYPSARLWGEYIWLWLTWYIMVSVHLPIFLWIRGNLSVDSECWWKVKFYWRPSNVRPCRASSIRNRPGLPALAILAYPLLFTIAILPVSVLRWINFTHHDNIHTVATFVSIFLFGCTGLFNVILLLSTRQQLLLFGEPDGMAGLDDSSTRGPRRPPSTWSIAGSFSMNENRRTSRDFGLSNNPGSGPKDEGRLPSPSESGWNTPRTSQELP